MSTHASPEKRKVFTRIPRLSADSEPSLIRIAVLGAYLSRRTVGRLERAGFATLGDIACDARRLAQIEGLGEKSYAEVVSCMRAHGLMTSTPVIRRFR